MSARRKGKPQQRKKIETAEPQQDLITCGDCNKEFNLTDIVKFIQHKVNRCNKENVDPLENNDSFERGEGEDEVVSSSSIPNRRTSISAPIAHRSTPELREKCSPRPSRELPSTHNTDGAKTAKLHRDNDYSDEEEGDEDDPRPRRVNTASNTVNQEPKTFTCVACQITVSSAWVLMQHAQHKHNICIYMDDKSHIVSPPSRVKQEDVEPGELNTSTLSCNNDTTSSKRSEQGNSPSVHSNRIPHQKEGDHGLNTSRDLSLASQQSTPRSMASTPPPSLNLDALPPTPSSLMFRMPHPDRQISPAAGGGLVPFSRPPPSEFRLDFGMNPTDPFQRMPGIGLPTTSTPGFDHQLPGISSNPFDRHLRVTPGESGMSAQDFYSQRLRQLAGTTSPSQQSPEALRKPPHTPPFSQQPSTFSTSPTDPPTPGAETSPKQVMPPGKLKACEFCGKGFRFQSNLIVHRRSHTGEKPFKCPLCPHACSQASKLKRHMKTHNQGKSPHSSSALSQTSSMSTTSENSLRSTSSTPDSKLSKLEDEEESMDEYEDEEDEEAVMEEARKMGLIDEPGVNDLSKRNHELALGHAENSQEPRDLSNGSKDRTSLLSEVMEKTGLGSIQQYNEAFKQALEESTTTTTTPTTTATKRPEPSRSESSEVSNAITENGHDDSASGSEGRRTSSVTSRDQDMERMMNDSHGSLPSTPKRIKLEQEGGGIPPPHPPMPHYHNFNDQMWRTWIPPSIVPRDFFGMGAMPMPPDHFLHQGTIPRHENGFGADSPLRMADSVSKATGAGLASLPNHTPPGISAQHNLNNMRKSGDHHRRNDTCEFCGKIFKNCSNLTVHRRSHTGEKPYKCTMCSYACAQSSKLTRHMKTHGRLGKDVYNCKFCSMPFSVPSTLEKHMRKCVENQQNHVMHAAVAAAAAAASCSSQTSSIDSSEHSNSVASSPAII